ncbi:MAG: hypothetical protein K8R88_08715, partial [Armatimonadetes bacterium]|nr:hypothetical protein [Armatimonadota bacterium]
MTPITYGLIGLAAGWIIEFVIDHAFLRKHYSSLATEIPPTTDVVELKARLSAAESELGDLVVKLNAAESGVAELKELRVRLAATESDLVGA